MESKYYKSDDQVLTVERGFRAKGFEWETPRVYTYIFDFEFRTMTVIQNYRGYGTVAGENERAQVIPFPAVDPEVLDRMRDKLVELGGRPGPVSGPPEGKPAMPAPQNFRKGLNP